MNKINETRLWWGEDNTENNSRRLAIVRISCELWRETFGNDEPSKAEIKRKLFLPDTFTVDAYSYDPWFNYNEVALRLISPEFDEVQVGCCVPTITITYRRDEQGDIVCNGWQ